jgi:hypothetical protein
MSEEEIELHKWAFWFAESFQKMLAESYGNSEPGNEAREKAKRFKQYRQLHYGLMQADKINEPNE